MPRSQNPNPRPPHLSLHSPSISTSAAHQAVAPFQRHGVRHRTRDRSLAADASPTWTPILGGKPAQHAAHVIEEIADALRRIAVRGNPARAAKGRKSAKP